MNFDEEHIWLDANMWILYAAAILSVGVAQQFPEPNNMCSEGSCYPTTGDLLIGRAHRLVASSTCGIKGPEHFCIVNNLQAKKCKICDSRELYNEVTHPNSHTIDNVVTTFTPNRLVTWWQSENGLENVTIQLDLEAEFHFTHIIMTFKTFRPAAMIIERSSDYGQSWQVYRYFAYSCAASFPHISQGPVIAVDDVICDSRYSDIEPVEEGEVIFRALDPAFKISDPYSKRIQNLLRVTNLRVRMLKLHTQDDDLLDDQDEVKQKYYYALYDMVVRGSCFCYGHASECVPVKGEDAGTEGMVHGHCMCNHHTTGLNCERCEEFYQDLPWRPAEGRDTNKCKRCECNQHSSVCHFDMTMYLWSGNVSGGVCDECQHNTVGRHCEGCKPFYYQHPNRDIRDPRICQPCDCDKRGSLNGGVCDSVTDVMKGLIAGQCRCKPNVEGQRCDHCKQGHYGLGHAMLGCLPCSCNPLGTFPGGSPCDTNTGSCYCKRLVIGLNCNQCRPQHWGLSTDKDGCRPCDCDLGGALNNDCSPETGQCVCREHIFGRRCDQVKPGYYFTTLDHYLYEAEDAAFKPAVTVVPRQLHVDRQPTWTGAGFVNVPQGETLHFSVNNIPQPMDYNLLIRYEPQLPDVWEQVTVDLVRSAFPSLSAHCTTPYADQQTISLPPGSRYVVLARPLCLENGQNYTVQMKFTVYSSNDLHHHPHILIDSMVLLPVVQDMELFSDSTKGKPAWEMFQKYRCLENSQSVQKLPMTDICKEYIFSTSALLHEGAMECKCDPRGSLSSVCESIGGQCPCRTNVVGRKCETCAPGTYGLGPSGCRVCECDPLGSKNNFCNPDTGECSCMTGVYGRNCAHCLPAHWGFPQCHACFCNGHGEHCHHHTGHCLECRDHTTGQQCERCERGYHGNALLGSSDRCRPCMCPDGPGSGRQFADTCYQQHNSAQLTCVCSPGYKGPRCEDCAPGYYGNPHVAGGRCQPCQCNNNINMQDAGSCDAHTGVCLRCLHNTEGRACQHCKPAYFGDARSQTCQKCNCHFLGTAAHSCVGGECKCDQVSGQCSCLPGVEGLHCDRCIPNTWNINGGEGCEPCRCHPMHSYNKTCNVVTGQCLCKPGFGGRTCEECTELFWGNPEVKCSACDCDPQGTASPQCNKSTGACVCVKGASGQRCDSCGRGYVGTFPDCAPCHQCFREWDTTVAELTNQTLQLVDAVKDLAVSGVTGTYKDLISSLEGGAKEITQILKDEKAQQTLAHSKELLQQAKQVMSDVDGSLHKMEEDLQQVSEKHGHVMEKLNTLTQESRTQQDITDNTETHVLHIKHSHPMGALDSIRDYYQRSVDAERRVNQATTEPHSSVQHSAELRQAAESRLNEEFQIKQRLQSERLDTLNQELERHNLSKLSHQVCGGVHGSDDCGECGALGCVNEDGVSQCGGKDCKGLVSQSNNVWNKAKELDQNIMDSLNNVKKLHRMLSETHGRADKAKLSAHDVLLKTNQSKAKAERTNQELQELIQQLRDFLTGEVDLDRIESLSDEVLKLNMPVNASDLRNMMLEIKQHVSALTGVDEVLTQSAEQASNAEKVLHRARNVSEETTWLKKEAEGVKVALNGSEHAHFTTNHSLQAAISNLNNTKLQLANMESETADSEFKLSNATQRLLDLDRAVGYVQQKTKETSNTAKHNQIKADQISDDTDLTKEDLDLEVHHKYQYVSELMKQKAMGVSDARQRAEQLQREAEALVNDVIRKLERLGELERDFSVNQRILAVKAEELQDLEKTVDDITQEISQKVTVYSICL